MSSCQSFFCMEQDSFIKKSMWSGRHELGRELFHIKSQLSASLHAPMPPPRYQSLLRGISLVTIFEWGFSGHPTWPLFQLFAQPTLSFSDSCHKARDNISGVLSHMRQDGSHILNLTWKGAVENRLESTCKSSTSFSGFSTASFHAPKLLSKLPTVSR